MAKTAKCPQCGFVLRIDDAIPASCPECATPFKRRKKRSGSAKPQKSQKPATGSFSRQRVINTPVAHQTPLDSPRPTSGQYVTVVGVVALMMTVLMMSFAGGSPPAEIRPFGEAPEDLSSFPEVALLLTPTEEEVAEKAAEEYGANTEEALLKRIRLITTGESPGTEQQQRQILTMAASDRRPKVVLAVVNALQRFDTRFAAPLLSSAIENHDPETQQATVTELSRRADSKSVAIMMKAFQLTPALRQPISEALESIELTIAEPAVAKQFAHQEMIEFATRKGSLLSLDRLMQIKSQAAADGLPTDRWDNAIQKIWQREIRRVESEEFWFERRTMHIGDGPSLSTEAFIQLPVIEEYREPVTEALRGWSSKWPAYTVKPGSPESTYYATLQKWSGQTLDDLISHDLMSENERSRLNAVKQIALGDSAAGVAALFELAARPDIDREVLNAVQGLTGLKLIAAVDALKSTDSQTKLRAFRTLLKEKPLECIPLLYKVAMSGTEQSLLAQLALHHKAKSYYSYLPLSPEHNAQLLIASSRLVPEFSIFHHRRSTMGGLSESLKKQLVEHMLARQMSTLISNDRWWSREVAWEWLTVVDFQRMKPILLTELSADRTRNRHAAVRALATSESSGALQILVDGLSDDRLRFACLQGLAHAGAIAEDHVLTVLKDKDVADETLHAACGVLALAGTPRSLPFLDQIAAGDWSQNVTHQVAVAKREISSRPDRPVKLDDRRRDALGQQLTLIRKREERQNPNQVGSNVRTVLEQLKSSDPQKQATALCNLSNTAPVEQHRSAVMTAISEFIDPEKPVRCWFALQVCGRWGSENHVDKMVPFLEHDDPYLVTAAATGLSDMAFESSVAAIVRLMKSPRHSIIGRTALVRAARGDSAAVVAEAIQPLLADSLPEIRVNAAVVLAELGEEEGIEQMQLLFDTSPLIQPFEEALEKAHQYRSLARQRGEQRTLR